MAMLGFAAFGRSSDGWTCRLVTSGCFPTGMVLAYLELSPLALMNALT